ncbi:MAG: hypothetical protein AAF845_16830 [Bacteroidota bacterium]
MLTLDEALRSELERRAEESGRPIAELAREAVRVGLFGEETSPPVAIGDMARSLILEGLTNEAVVERVLAAVPDAKTSKESVAWYRSDMKKRGLPVPSQVEARRRQAGRD